VRGVKLRAKALALAPAMALGRLGLTPNHLTVLGSLLTGLVGFLAAQGWFLAAGVCLWLFSATDSLDGALARATNRVSPVGAFLDSVCDRFAESGVCLGILWWLHRSNDDLGVLLAYVAIIGSLMVSYSRARAEGIGVTGEVGWLQRPERIVILGLALMGASVVPVSLHIGLAILAVFTIVTVVQRGIHVYRLLASRPAG
jgi:CDP-diacylglycerol--glycerol-3-phosphate 3-phosphatidyltransferase